MVWISDKAHLLKDRNMAWIDNFKQFKDELGNKIFPKLQAALALAEQYIWSWHSAVLKIPGQCIHCVLWMAYYHTRATSLNWRAQKLKMWYKGSLGEFIMAFVTDTDRLFRGCKFACLGSARLTEDLTAQNKKETSIAAHERKMYECKQ